MGTPLRCTVVSAEQTLFIGEAEHLVAPGWNGELGVYHQHAPMVARLGVGLVRIHQDGGAREAFAVRGGFLEVHDDAVQLLVTEARRFEDVDVAALPGALDAVKQRLQNPGSDEQFQELLIERRWLETQAALLEYMKAAPMKAMQAASDAAKRVADHYTHSDPDMKLPNDA